jgi:hypothetical protein
MCFLPWVPALAEPAAPDTQGTVIMQEAPAAPDAGAAQALPAAPPAKAAKPVDRSDKVPHRYPMVALALSGVFPGGGQLYTQKYFRAAAFAGALAYFGYGYCREDRAMGREVDLANSAATAAEFLQHRDSYYAHYDNRRSFQWWGVGVWLFSMMDAYIDAHMFKFDERAQEPRIGLRAGPNSLALSTKF